MPRDLKLALVQLGAIEGELERTLAKAEDLVREASSKGAEVAILPEFFSREYFPQYRDLRYVRYAEDENGPTFQAVREWGRRFSVSLVAGIYERVQPGLYYNSAIYVGRDGEIKGKFRKAHPAAVRSLEKLYYRGGVDFSVTELEGWKVGGAICYDLWFPEAMRCSALNGAELMAVPYASWEEPLWREVIQTRAFENGVYVAVCNKVGREGEWRLHGHSLICDPGGRIVLECSRTDDDVQIGTIQLDSVEEARVTYPMYRDRRPEIYGRISRLQE